MGDTPIERICYCLWKFTGDFSFIAIEEDIAINRARALLKIFEDRNPNDRGPSYDELKKHLEDYFEDLLLNRSV